MESGCLRLRITRVRRADLLITPFVYSLFFSFLSIASFLVFCYITHAIKKIIQRERAPLQQEEEEGMFITIMVLLILLLSPFFSAVFVSSTVIITYKTRAKSSPPPQQQLSFLLFLLCFYSPKEERKETANKVVRYLFSGAPRYSWPLWLWMTKTLWLFILFGGCKIPFFSLPLLRSLQSAWYKPRRLQRLMICQECWEFYILSKRQSSTWFVPTEW